MEIKSNQYLPKGRVSTYYYIVDSHGRTWHRIGTAWRIKSAKDLKHYYFLSLDAANLKMEELKNEQMG